MDIFWFEQNLFDKLALERLFLIWVETQTKNTENSGKGKEKGTLGFSFLNKKLLILIWVEFN